METQNLNESSQRKERKIGGPASNTVRGHLSTLKDLLVLVKRGKRLLQRMDGSKKENFTMKKHYLALILFASLCQAGCAFLGGAAVGSLATGAGYEVNAKRQIDKLEDDYRNERISRREYQTRKKQIEAGSIIY